MLSQLPNALVSAVILAGLYALVGLSWVLLFRATKIFNFGTGQFVILGAYVYFGFSNGASVPWWAAAIGTLVCMALVGAAVQSIFLRPLLGTPAHAVGHAPFAPVILTFGIAAVVQHSLTLAFGYEPKPVTSPLPDVSLRLPGYAILTADGVLVWVLAAVLIGGTLLVMRYSRWGIQMRAAAEQPLLASQSGINVENVAVGAWVVAACICAFGGVSYSFSNVLSPDLADIGIRALAPVMVGGMDSVIGVLPGALVVAVAENLLVLVFGESVRDAAVMLVILCVLAIRPNGLFGTGDIRRL